MMLNERGGVNEINRKMNRDRKQGKEMMMRTISAI